MALVWLLPWSGYYTQEWVREEAGVRGQLRNLGFVLGLLPHIFEQYAGYD